MKKLLSGLTGAAGFAAAGACASDRSWLMAALFLGIGTINLLFLAHGEVE